MKNGAWCPPDLSLELRFLVTVTQTALLPLLPGDEISLVKCPMTWLQANQVFCFLLHHHYHHTLDHLLHLALSL